MEPKIEMISLLPINDDGDMRHTFEIAYYTETSQRCVYSGALHDPEQASLARSEHYLPIQGTETQHVYGRGPWYGQTAKGPGAKALKAVRAFAFETLEKAVTERSILRQALEVAEVQEERVTAWVNERVQWLGASAPIGKGSYGLLDAVEWAVCLTEPYRAQSQRVRQLHRNLRGVYPQFGAKGESNEWLVAL